jgi:hypothetical protein
MLLGIKYEDVEKAFEGNLDPTKDHDSEALRMYVAFRALLEQHRRAILELFAIPPIAEGRRYRIAMRIADPSNPLSRTMTHSIVMDETGKVFDPNPEYGEFKSFEDWDAAMSLPHELDSVTEMFEYSV